MMPVLELFIPPQPMARRPDRPALGEHVQVLWYHVSARMVGGRETFYVHNVEGEVLSMGYDWDRLCHQLGWFPLDGLEHRARLPDELPPGPSKADKVATAAKRAAEPGMREARPRAIDPGTRAADPGIDPGTTDRPAADDPRQGSLF